jgi:hypothetical protein
MTSDDTNGKTDDVPADEATPLAPGVWVTETTGFASVPPRAQSDLADAARGEASEREGGSDEPRSSKHPDC